MAGGRGGLRFGGLAFLALLGAAEASPQPVVPAVAADTRLGDSPATARLASSAGALRGAVVVLLVEDIHGRSQQPIRINVFVDKPDADHTTPTTDDSWAGIIQLMPRDGAIGKAGAILDVSEQIARARGRSIAITLVPVVGTDDRPRGVDLTIGKIRIQNETQ